MNLRRALVSLTISTITVLALTIVVAGLALSAQSDPDTTLGVLPGQVADIPPEMLAIYARTGKEYDIDWAVLAAIGKVESDHNRSKAAGVHSGVNFAGCCAGSMQISLAGGSASTWGRFKVDGNRDGVESVYDPRDAIPTAAAYLKAAGAPRDYQRAIFAYNHAQWYVDKIQKIAGEYRSLTTAPPVAAAPWQVVANPRITLTPGQRSDIAQGRVDKRVIGLLALIAREHTVYVSSLRSDHSRMTASGNVSNHSLGRAVDIAMIDGEACTGTHSGNCGQVAIKLGRLTGALRSSELIYCFDPDGPASADAFAQSDHCDHIHVGYSA